MITICGHIGHSTDCAFFFDRHQAQAIKPSVQNPHLTNMQVRALLLALVVSFTPILFTGCNACVNKPTSPDQVRQETAAATAQLKDDAKAVAQGVREGLTRPSADQPVGLNTASEAQLMSLPGMDDAAAERVIAGRPYSSEHQLLERRILSREEYGKIADSITVKK
jgi:DNA uptake protein ComE-like DNA-binding protein